VGRAWAAAEPSPGKTSRCFELAVYYAAPGKLDDWNPGSATHTLKPLREARNDETVRLLDAQENPDNQLILPPAYPSRDAARKPGQDFGADPGWKEVVGQTEANGRLVTRSSPRI